MELATELNKSITKTLSFHKKSVMIITLLFLTIVILMIAFLINVLAEKYPIPSWVRNTITDWGNGRVDDTNFIQVIQWLIQNKIITTKENTNFISNNVHVPSWMKKPAHWWSNGQIEDSEFVNEIQYLIQKKLININATPTVGLDKFGIGEINPTIPNGREWFSKWDDGIPRTIKSGSRDPDDSMFIARGDATIMIDGDGIANMKGKNPRMYVYDAAKLLKWKNVEVTFYGKRIDDFFGGTKSPAGFNIGARSNHQDQGGGINASDCNVDTYYSRILYNGNANFVKELYQAVEGARIPKDNRIKWEGLGDLPYDTWIGHKFVLRNIDADKHVQLQMYLDLTDGKKGGDWKLVAQAEDDGNWTVPDNPCGIPVNKIILDGNPSVFIRNTNINSALYKEFSIREISPLP